MPQFRRQHAGRWTSLVLILSLPVAVWAVIEEPLALAIYSESGAEQQLKQTARTFPKGVREGLAQDSQGKRFDPDVAERLAREAFDPDAIQKPLIAALREELAPAHATEILTWLRSDLGRQISALEIAAATPQAEAAMVKFAQGLEKQLPPGARLRLIQSLDNAIKLTDTAVQMTLNMSVAAALGPLAVQGTVAETDLKGLRTEMEKERGYIQEALEAQTFAHLLFAYRSLSDQEIQRYIDFATSEAGASYHRVIFRGLDRAVSQATLTLAQELAKLAPRAGVAAN